MGVTRYHLQRTGALHPLREGQGPLPMTPTSDSPARPPESYTGLRYQALPERERKTEKTYRLQMTLWIGLPVEPVGDPGRAPKCCAQVTKFPNDHQVADIQCKSKRVFITKPELGLPLIPMQRL